jgi:hypothetical protein
MTRSLADGKAMIAWAGENERVRFYLFLECPKNRFFFTPRRNP